jgi:hypothetical protein
VAASSLQGTPTHRRRLGWALGEEGGGSESLRRGPRPPYLTGKASSMRGGGAVMYGDGAQSEEATRSRAAGFVSFRGTPEAQRHGGMELGGLDEAVDGNQVVVADSSAGWRPSSHWLGRWRCQTGLPNLGAPQRGSIGQVAHRW